MRWTMTTWQETSAGDERWHEEGGGPLTMINSEMIIMRYAQRKGQLGACAPRQPQWQHWGAFALTMMESSLVRQDTPALEEEEAVLAVVGCMSENAGCDDGMKGLEEYAFMWQLAGGEVPLSGCGQESKKIPTERMRVVAS